MVCSASYWHCSSQGWEAKRRKRKGVGPADPFEGTPPISNSVTLRGKALMGGHLRSERQPTLLSFSFSTVTGKIGPCLRMQLFEH